MASFSELGLSEPLLKALTKMGIETPTEIQSESIPILLKDPQDFIGLAQTGTGKTAAFGIPLLERIDPKDKSTQALILAPTRELGQQIADQIQQFAKNMPRMSVEVVYGGASIRPQIDALRRGVQILVATPGRLIDLAKRKAVRLGDLQYLILDEADEMLNMGFREELDEILKFTPKEKVTWLFSATMPKEIRRIVAAYMTEPVEVAIQPKSRVNSDIEHQCVVVKLHDRPEALRRIMDHAPDMYGLIFCRTKIGTQKLATQLGEMGYRVDALHGDLSQQQRNWVMDRFKKRQVDLVVATDVAARGIDVVNLTHVIHYDIPGDTESYTHRSGRTARAGRKGISLALITKADQSRINRYAKQLKFDLKQIQIPKVEEVLGNRVEHWAKRLAAMESETPVPDDLVARAETALGSIERSELIRTLLAQELKRLGYSGKGKDLNQGGSNQAEHRSTVPEGFHRFFINIGRLDKIRQGDLVKLICEHTDMTRETIGTIELRETHSFFEVKTTDQHTIEPAFKDVKIRGRRLRVNLDTPENGRDSRGGGGGGKSRSHRPREFRGKSGAPRGKGFRRGGKHKPTS